ncbi:MAG: glutamine-hydrolyzing GMP synthase, partial [Bacteroidota bacterium]
MTEKILILDFGSQYTQLIARAVREANVFCEIIPFQQKFDAADSTLKGVILSGSPCSVNEEDAPTIDISEIVKHVPVFGICYGAQLMAKQFGGRVDKSNKREYGRAKLIVTAQNELLDQQISGSQVWMSHSDSITVLPENFELLGQTESIPVAAFRKNTNNENGLFGIQFHPEVYHTTAGKNIIKNFLVNICHCTQDWTPAMFVQETIDKIKKEVGNSHVIMALSGGVDSTVAATLIHKAIGKNLYGIFVDNGLLRKNEFEDVLATY